MFAVLYKFGIQHAVGADALSNFFKLIRIGTHVGISPSALRTQLSKIEALTLTFQDSREQSAPAQTRKGVDLFVRYKTTPYKRITLLS